MSGPIVRTLTALERYPVLLFMLVLIVAAGWFMLRVESSRQAERIEILRLLSKCTGGASTP